MHAEDVEQRALAGARRPHDRHEVALLDVGVDAAQDEGLRQAVPVGLFDAGQFDHVSGSGSGSGVSGDQRSGIACHSVRSAVIGSTRMARLAGT